MKVLAQNRTRAFDKKAVVKCAAAVALLIAASKVSFAIGPVPLTMQTFADGSDCRLFSLFPDGCRYQRSVG